jgi:pyridoxine kinase
VIGDDRDGVYVRPGIAEMLRDRMLPAADIATPNRFELEMLIGGPVPHARPGQGRRGATGRDAASGWAALRAADQPAHRDHPDDAVDMLCA